MSFDLLSARGPHAGRRPGGRAAQAPGALRARRHGGLCRTGAALFLQLDAQFAGFAQILVYIGAVAILVVFAILLTRGSDLPKGRRLQPHMVCRPGHRRRRFRGAGLGRARRACSALPQQTAAPAVTVHDIGVALVGRYVLPLEIVALLLTAATIGAVIVAMHEKERCRE